MRRSDSEGRLGGGVGVGVGVGEGDITPSVVGQGGR